MKHPILSALAFLLPGSAFALATDINGDKSVDAADAQAFLAAVAAGSPPALDLDGDGKTGLPDALLYGRWIDGLWDKPSAGLGSLYFRNPADSAAYAKYQSDVKANESKTMAGLKADYPDRTAPMPLPEGTVLQYEAEVTAAFAKLSGSAWNKASFMSQVRAEGMAVSKAAAYPNYFQALDAIYHNDLPLLFTSDALLHTVYLSYDNILMELEQNLLIPSLESILRRSADYAAAAYGNDQAGKDVLELLGTAMLLLDKTRSDVTAGPEIATHLADISAGTFKRVSLWGRDTTVDFSQFKPRGHYTRTPKLGAYFQAMMWLSRADLAFDLRSKPVKDAAAYTRMKKASVTLWDCLVNSGAYASWLEFDHYIAYLVGPSDGLNAKGMGLVMRGLGATSAPALVAAFPEARFDSVVAAGNFGAQAILSQQKDFTPKIQDADLSPIFSFMPQRFILDSYTLSQVVFPATGAAWPGSAGMAFVLGDNSAANDITETAVKVPGMLASQRALYDRVSEEGWQANLYSSWLGFLRKLNGAEANARSAPVFRSRAWRVKTRNTQLASWAQLRHNTILYSKQSYTGTVLCSYPKAYVEPYPEFFAAVAAYAGSGEALFRTANPGVADYFRKLEATGLKLRDAAARAAGGMPPTQEQSEWLRSALAVKSEPRGCTSVKVLDGWFIDLIYAADRQGAMESQSYTIADVHTKPSTDELGPNGVLHVGTGGINLAAVAIQGDSCATLFVAPVGSFYEVRRLNTLERMTDEEWTKSFSGTPPQRPVWMSRIIGP